MSRTIPTYDPLREVYAAGLAAITRALPGSLADTIARETIALAAAVNAEHDFPDDARERSDKAVATLAMAYPTR